MSDEHWTDGADDEGWFDPTNPWTPLPGVRTGSELTFGERAADTVRRKMGSWGFVFGFLGVIIFWCLLNSIILGKNAADPFPYILLNLLLSLLAGLQGAILLIAAKRADAVAAEQALSHLTISKASGEIIKEVRAEIKEIRRLAKSIQELVELEKKEHGKTN